jgi:hypothetical protein
MMLRVPRISDPTIIVDVTVTDLGGCDGAYKTRFEFEGQTVERTSDAKNVDERMVKDCAFLRGYNLDLERYHQWASEQIERFGRDAPWVAASVLGWNVAGDQKATKRLATNLRIVSMIEFKGKIYVASANAVFVHDPTRPALGFRQMEFVELPPEAP